MKNKYILLSVFLLLLILISFFPSSYSWLFLFFYPEEAIITSLVEKTATQISEENCPSMCKIVNSITYEAVDPKEDEKIVSVEEQYGGSGVFVSNRLTDSRFTDKAIIYSVSHLTKTVGAFESCGPLFQQMRRVKSVEYLLFPQNDPKHYYKGEPICNGIDRDLAVFSANIPASSYRAAKIGNSNKVKVGDALCLAGYPGEDGLVFTSGIVTGIHKEGAMDSYYMMDYIQTNAYAGRGNSGGPAFNRYGEVVGLINHILASEGQSISFVVPINFIPKPPYDPSSPVRLIPTIGCELPLNTFPRDGENIASYSDETCDSFGDWVKYDKRKSFYRENLRAILLKTENNDAVVTGLHSWNSTFIEGDVIEEVNGNSVRNRYQLVALLSNFKAGDKVTVKFKRAIAGKMVEFKKEVELVNKDVF